MKTFILGNSLVRGLAVPGAEVISIGGLDFEKAVKVLMDRRSSFRGAVIYVVVGPLRFSTLHRSRRESAFTASQLYPIPEMFRPFFEELKFLDMTPIVCPLFPMDFEKYNAATCSRPLMTAFYGEWNQLILGEVERENRTIMMMNEQFGLRAFMPCLHSRIFRKRGKARRRYEFRVCMTSDGLHVTPEVTAIWQREFARVMEVHARVRALGARVRAEAASQQQH